MLKETKRKAFNFLRSYFDVYNELQNDKDRLSFLQSIINKQFLDEDPEGLNFIVNLCYESQRHPIETSVKGWKRATNDTLGTTPPTTLGTTPPTTSKEEEEEEKGEEEEKDKNKGFDLFWDLYDNKKESKTCLSKWIKLSDKDRSKIMEVLPAYILSTPDKKYRKLPTTWINRECWNDEIEVKGIKALSNPNNEEIVKYKDNVGNSGSLIRSKFEVMKANNANGGYIYTEIR